MRACFALAAAVLLPDQVGLADPIFVGSGPDRAEVVIEFGDGAFYEFAVSFEGTTTGLGLFDIIELETTLETERLDFGFGEFIDGISFEGHSNSGYGGGEDWWHYWVRESGDAEWAASFVGAGDRVVTDGDADGWVYGHAGPPVPEPSSALLLGIASLVVLRRTLRQRGSGGEGERGRCGAIRHSALRVPHSARPGIAIALTAISAQAADPWADRVVAASATLDGSGLYNDPASVLGMPTTTFYDNGLGQQFVTSLAVGAFNLDAPSGNKVVTTLFSGQFIKLEFDEPVEDHPRNPYGLDLLVFGNAFFAGDGFVGPETDMEAHLLSGGLFAEPVTVAVSATGIGDPQSHPGEWFVYASGPFGDDLFPTNARQWDRSAGGWGEPCDFTLPVDHALGLADFEGISAADAIDLYEGAGGGTGFDLAESGFAAIRYVYLTAAGGEVDALADVFPCLGDLDRDGDLDLADVAAFQACFGPERPAACRCADFDGDYDVGLADWSAFVAFSTGPA